MNSSRNHTCLDAMQVDVRSAAVGGRMGDPRRQGQRSGGAGALRNLWQNMWRNNGEGESSADYPPGYQVRPISRPSLLAHLLVHQALHCPILHLCSVWTAQPRPGIVDCLFHHVILIFRHDLSQFSDFAIRQLSVSVSSLKNSKHRCYHWTAETDQHHLGICPVLPLAGKLQQQHPTSSCVHSITALYHASCDYALQLQAAEMLCPITCPCLL